MEAVFSAKYDGCPEINDKCREDIAVMKPGAGEVSGGKKGRDEVIKSQT